MAITYGALRGRFDRAVREDGAATPHLQVRVLADGGNPWRLAINVQSQDGSDVVYWVVDPLPDHPVLAATSAMPVGFAAVAGDAAHALDFTKAPLFDMAKG